MCRAKLFFWLPRVLGVLAISLIGVLSVDLTNGEIDSATQLQSLVIHLVPTYLLLIFFLVATRWENVGGVFFLVIGLLASPYLFFGNYNMGYSFAESFGRILSVTIPLVFVGILFILNYENKRRMLTRKNRRLQLSV